MNFGLNSQSFHFLHLLTKKSLDKIVIELVGVGKSEHYGVRDDFIWYLERGNKNFPCLDMDENEIKIPTSIWFFSWSTFEATYFKLSTSEISMSTINEQTTQDNGASDSTDDTTEFPD